MKKAGLNGGLCLILILGLAAGCSEKTAQNSDDRLSEEQIQELFNKARDLGEEEKFAMALEKVRPLAAEAGRFSGKPAFQYEILDYQHFLFLKTGAFREALQNGFELEALGRKIGGRASPWDCLKIADAYLGLKEYDKAVDWVEKAVRERNFTRLDTLRGGSFAPVKDVPRFKMLLEEIEMSLGIGQPALDFRVTLLDGTPFALSDQKGKIVLIDFWDVRCVPCRRAIPHLKELHEKFAGRGLVIIGLSLDTDRKLLDNFLKKTALPWKTACSFKGWDDEMAKLFRVNATPSTWLIDRQGILRAIDLTGDNLNRAILELL